MPVGVLAAVKPPLVSASTSISGIPVPEPAAADAVAVALPLPPAAAAPAAAPAPAPAAAAAAPLPFFLVFAAAEAPFFLLREQKRNQNVLYYVNVTKIDERIGFGRRAETVAIETGLDGLATFLDVVHTLGDGVLEVTSGRFVPASHASQTTVRSVDVLLKKL